ncbi:hypothetical protein F5Y18DRAFT_378387 [Xylariaceae sp. FL1019]|nr:hypothetical protein F5Y18DRAFT_378387 [Xylariaceae sp. FL1019]
MDRTLYVLVYPSRLFAAHWSLWIPHVQDFKVGDRIHVTGDRLNGFQYEYIRSYDVSDDDRHPNAFPIGSVNELHLKGVEDNSANTAEEMSDGNNSVCNAFDEACRQIPAPGPSLNKVSIAGGSTATAGPPKKAQVKDCQWWVKEVVSHLMEKQMLLPLEEGNEIDSPISKVDGLPRH